MSPRTTTPGRGAIPVRALLAGESPGALDVGASMRAVAEGLQAAGLPAPDECPLADAGAPALESAGYDGRMRAARAVVILAAALRPAELPGSAAFELATRARQAGVPAYAITGENGLDSFDERILDLELVIEARTARELRAAGARLAEVI